MAHLATTVGTYGARDRPGPDALEYAVMAEDALARDDPDRCGAALELASERAAAVATDRSGHHLHLVMRSMTATVDRARDSLAAGEEDAAADARAAIRAIRSTVNRIDPTAVDRVDRYPVAVGRGSL